MSLLAVVALTFLTSSQEPSGPTPGELVAMKKLSFLAGKWEGDGWMRMGPGEPSQFTGSENVQVKLQGKALLVEGKFKDKTSQKVIHETLAIISFDEKSGKYRFSAYLFNRPPGEYVLEAKERGFCWGIQPPSGPKIDYTMTLTETGEWHEVGEYEMTGQGKVKFLEMRLKKL